MHTTGRAEKRHKKLQRKFSWASRVGFYRVLMLRGFFGVRGGLREGGGSNLVSSPEIIHVYGFFGFLKSLKPAEELGFDSLLLSGR